MATDSTTLSFTIRYFDLRWLIAPAIIFWFGNSFVRFHLQGMAGNGSGLVRRFLASDRFWKAYVIVGYIYFLELVLYYARHDDLFQFAAALFVVLPVNAEICRMISRAWLGYRTRRVLKKVKRYYEKSPC